MEASLSPIFVVADQERRETRPPQVHLIPQPHRRRRRRVPPEGLTDDCIAGRRKDGGNFPAVSTATSERASGLANRWPFSRKTITVIITRNQLGDGTVTLLRGATMEMGGRRRGSLTRRRRRSRTWRCRAMLDRSGKARDMLSRENSCGRINELTFLTQIRFPVFVVAAHG